MVSVCKHPNGYDITLTGSLHKFDQHATLAHSNKKNMANTHFFLSDKSHGKPLNLIRNPIDFLRQLMLGYLAKLTQMSGCYNLLSKHTAQTENTIPSKATSPITVPEHTKLYRIY